MRPSKREAMEEAGLFHIPKSTDTDYFASWDKMNEDLKVAEKSLLLDEHDFWWIKARSFVDKQSQRESGKDT